MPGATRRARRFGDGRLGRQYGDDITRTTFTLYEPMIALPATFVAGYRLQLAPKIARKDRGMARREGSGCVQ